MLSMSCHRRLPKPKAEVARWRQRVARTIPHEKRVTEVLANIKDLYITLQGDSVEVLRLYEGFLPLSALPKYAKRTPITITLELVVGYT
jgi:hypothetical protein